MEALDAQLLQRDPPLAMLFTPPFEKSAQEPGYVKAYPRGIRENGGQYTHAAVWTAIAFAMQGNAERAMEVFNMLNPIRRSMTRADVQRYKVEPYVVAADVYSEAPHAGTRRLDLVHRLRGLAVSRGSRMDPRFPPAREPAHADARACRPSWPGFTIRYRHRGPHHSRLTKSSSTNNPIRVRGRSS